MNPGYRLSHPEYPSFKAVTCLLISDIKTLVLRYDDLRAWTQLNTTSVIRYMKFPGLEKIYVVLPDAWWMRGENNVPHERKCRKLVRARLEGDRENVKVEIRLVYKMEDIFNEDFCFVSASSGWEIGGGFAAWMKETGSEVKTVRLDELGFIVSLQACTVTDFPYIIPAPRKSG
jgi:hypothetical protein